MTRLDVLMFATSALFLGGTAYADERSVECASSPVALSTELKRTKCQILESVVIVRYLGGKPLSPYATDLDQRELAVAYGKNAATVKAVAGMGGGSHAVSMQSRLLQPPSANQISKFGPSKSTRYKNWRISNIEVEYGAQGGARGFFLNCATATRSSNKKTTIVTECFPFEEKARFTQTLNLVR